MQKKTFYTQVAWEMCFVFIHYNDRFNKYALNSIMHYVLATSASGTKRTFLKYPFCRQLTQSSSVRPGTRSNSSTLFVTSTAPAAMACPAIAVSFEPIGVPARRSATLISVVASTAAQSQGRMASRRVQNASTSCTCRGEAFGPVAPKRISE